MCYKCHKFPVLWEKKNRELVENGKHKTQDFDTSKEQDIHNYEEKKNKQNLNKEDFTVKTKYWMVN